jgi:hypothetical protein
MTKMKYIIVFLYKIDSTFMHKSIDPYFCINSYRKILRNLLMIFVRKINDYIILSLQHHIQKSMEKQVQKNPCVF